MHTIPFTPLAGPDLYNVVRASFVARGSSLNAWCRTNNVNRQTVEKALKGDRLGVRSQELCRRIVDEVLRAT